MVSRTVLFKEDWSEELVERNAFDFNLLVKEYLG